jgi:hypothetical protein
MKTKKRMTLMVITALVSFILVMGWTVFAGNGNGDQNTKWPPDLGPRFDGAWIVAAPTAIGGKVVHTTFQTAQDVDGLRYTVVMEHSECSPTAWGAFPEANKQSDMVGCAEKIGPTTVKGTLIGYGIKAGELEDELIYIEVCSYESELIDDNTAINTATQSFYTPDQDTDGDGFPDEGQKPVLCMPYTVEVKRVTWVPMCESTPMP